MDLSSLALREALTDNPSLVPSRWRIDDCVRDPESAESEVLDDLALEREKRLLCWVVSLVVGDGVPGDDDDGEYGSISNGVGRCRCRVVLVLGQPPPSPLSGGIKLKPILETASGKLSTQPDWLLGGKEDVPTSVSVSGA